MSASGICKQAGDMQGNEPGYVQPRGRLHRVRAQSQSTGTSPASRHSIQILEPRSCSNSNSHVPAAIAVLQAVRVGGANVDVDPTTATVALGLDDGTSHKGEDGCGNFDRHDWELPKRRYVPNVIVLWIHLCSSYGLEPGGGGCGGIWRRRRRHGGRYQYLKCQGKEETYGSREK